MNDIEVAAQLIRVVVGVTMVSFGVHQLINPQSWSDYLPEWFCKLLPESPNTFMRTHGVGNLSLGLIFAIGLWPAILDWVVLLWWLSILPFAFYSDWAVGMRDLSIIAGIAALTIVGHPSVWS